MVLQSFYSDTIPYSLEIFLPDPILHVFGELIHLRN